MMTAGTMGPAMTTEKTMEKTDGSQRRRGSRLMPSGLRARVLVYFVGLLALATLASVVVTRTVLVVRLDQRISDELTQETAELRRLAAGTDPATGRPFGTNVRRVFKVYLSRNVPSRHEALITFVQGEPFLRSRNVSPYRLDRDPELRALWGEIAQPLRGRVQTPAGRVEYIAVPLRVRRETAGVFVAAIFYDRAKAETNEAVYALALIGLVMLVAGSFIAWHLADRIVGPVRELTRTARSISETDLTRRIPVKSGDEVGTLAATFNDMVDRLERAFALQRQFVDDAGHELKTPLTIVRGHLELLEDAPAAQEQTIALVLDELDRMARIVDDLLLLAKHEQPDFLDLTTVDVALLTEEIYAKVQALSKREWSLEDRGRGIIVADRQRLTQAIVQLAQNADTHAPNGEVVTIGSEVAGGVARFWVRDHGPGIRAEDQGRIFQRFRRAGVRRTAGAGLGLAIVRAIAEAHRGRVDVESAPGAGSTFTLIVPVEQPQTTGAAKP
jgi:signal transduction histidine kinase